MKTIISVASVIALLSIAPAFAGSTAISTVGVSNNVSNHMAQGNVVISGNSNRSMANNVNAIEVSSYSSSTSRSDPTTANTNTLSDPPKGHYHYGW